MSLQRKPFPRKVSNKAAAGRAEVRKYKLEEVERKKKTLKDRRAFEALKKRGN